MLLKLPTNKKWKNINYKKDMESGYTNSLLTINKDCVYQGTLYHCSDKITTLQATIGCKLTLISRSQ